GGYGGGNNAGGGAGLGGAIFNEAGTINIINSTFAANSAAGGAGGLGGFGGAGPGLGGALFHHNGTIPVTHSPLSRNTPAPGSRAISNLGDGATASVTINNTIIGQADTSVEDFTGTINGTGINSTAGSNNLIRTYSGFAGAVGSTANPLLGLLQ